MAYLHRLTSVLVLALVAWFPVASYATTVPALHWYAANWPVGGHLVVSQDPVAMCNELFTQRAAAGGTGIAPPITVSGINCLAGGTFFGGLGEWYACPAGSSALDTITQTCTVNVVVVNNCSAYSGKSAGSWGGPGTTGAKTLCDTSMGGAGSGDPLKPGCEVTGTSNFASGGWPDGTGADGYKWTATMKYSGASCAGGGGYGSGSKDGDSPCPSGQMAGLVNGVRLCYTPGPDVPKTTQATGSNTSKNPDGTQTKTDTTTKTECTSTNCTTTTDITRTPIGTTGTPGTPVTTTTTSTCTRGAPGCNTVAPVPPTVTTTTTGTNTTTTTGPGGTTTTTGTTTGTNTSTITGGGGSTGGGSTTGGGGGGGNGDGDGSLFLGNCSAGYSCDGDAIMCAIAQEQHRRDCQFYEPSGATEHTDRFTQLTSVTGDVTGTGDISSSVSLSASSFSSVDAIGAGAGCIKDKSISVWNHAYTVPFSRVCPELEMLGSLLLFLSWMAAIKIFRG